MFTSTYSMWSTFNLCRKRCAWRHIHGLAPVEKNTNLAFGSLIHNCLETWYQHHDFAKVLTCINQNYPNHLSDETERRNWQLAVAMMRGYVKRYEPEPFEVIALEKTFQGNIVNPATGGTSRTFTIAGKVDGIVKIDGEYWLLEHKTASQLTGQYIDRLWSDFQVTLYAWYIEQCLKTKLTGVIYNVLIKSRIKQKKGEGDSTFQERLYAKYQQPDMFHRESLLISRNQFERLRYDLWELTQQFLSARRRGTWHQNTESCYPIGRSQCPYIPLCRADGNLNLVGSLYEHQPPNQELVTTTN